MISSPLYRKKILHCLTGFSCLTRTFFFFFFILILRVRDFFPYYIFTARFLLSSRVPRDLHVVFIFRTQRFRQKHYICILLNSFSSDDDDDLFVGFFSSFYARHEFVDRVFFTIRRPSRAPQPAHESHARPILQLIISRVKTSKRKNSSEGSDHGETKYCTPFNRPCMASMKKIFDSSRVGYNVIQRIVALIKIHKPPIWYYTRTKVFDLLTFIRERTIYTRFRE